MCSIPIFFLYLHVRRIEKYNWEITAEIAMAFFFLFAEKKYITRADFLFVNMKRLIVLLDAIQNDIQIFRNIFARLK